MGGDWRRMALEEVGGAVKESIAACKSQASLHPVVHGSVSPLRSCSPYQYHKSVFPGKVVFSCPLTFDPPQQPLCVSLCLSVRRVSVRPQEVP